MSCEQIHEVTLKDIGAIIDGAKEGILALKSDRDVPNRAWSSIAKATSNMTLVFPVLVSRNMPIETAQMIAKTCERDDASMLQVLFSAMSVANTKDNGIDYVTSIHKNLKLGDSINLDDFIDTMNSLPESATISYREAYDMVKEDMKNINYVLPDSISENGLNQYKLIREGSNFVLLEDPNPRTGARYLNGAYEDELDYIPDIEPMKIDNLDREQIEDNIRRDYDKILPSEPNDNNNKSKSDDKKDIPYISFSDFLNTVDQDTKKYNREFFNKVVSDYKKLSSTAFMKTAGFNVDQFKNDFIDLNLNDVVTKDMPENERENSKKTIKEMKPSKMINDSINRIKNSTPKQVEAMATSTDIYEKLAYDIFNMYYLKRIGQDGPPSMAKAFDMVMNANKYNDEKAAKVRADGIQLMTDIRKAVNDTREYNLKVRQYNLDLAKFKDQIRQAKIKNMQQVEKDLSDRNSRMLIDTDVKKANELIPTLMNVTFRRVIDNVEVASSIVVGVKAKLIPLDSSDIIERIVAKNKDNNYFVKFFRATTREISFVKDFIFSIDKAKSDAISFSKKGKSNSIWKVLESRAKISKAKRLIGKNNSAMAISTLIITAEEAEMLKKMHGVDMYKPTVAANIMRSYNLMAFGIIDDSLQTFRFMKDNGENVFETYAYSALEKELRDGAAAKAINVIAKAQR